MYGLSKFIYTIYLKVLFQQNHLVNLLLDQNYLPYNKKGAKMDPAKLYKVDKSTKNNILPPLMHLFLL